MVEELPDPGPPKRRRCYPRGFRHSGATHSRAGHRYRPRGSTARFRCPTHRRHVRELHGHRRRRRRRRAAATRGAGQNRQRGRPLSAGRRARLPGRGELRVRDMGGHGRQGFVPPRPATQPGRTRASGQGLLHRAAARDHPGRVPGAHRQDVRVGVRRGGRRLHPGRTTHRGLRVGAGSRAVGPGRASRSRSDLQPAQSRRTGGGGAGVRLGFVGARVRSIIRTHRDGDRPSTRLSDGIRPSLVGGIAPGPQGLGELADHPQPRDPAHRRHPRGELRVQPSAAVRPGADQRQVAAGTVGRQRCARLRSGKALRRQALSG